ncbi:MAG: site-specific DNA-methyltransferase [Lachnospiraceae bacterium]|nr:site-specific DNA-methyltransferase [Lachnospiraceae bacterium]
MNKIFETLENLLKKDERFVSQDGKVIRNVVYEASNKMDEKLIMLLMSDETIKEAFFIKVNDILVFDKQKFNFVINNREMLPDSYTRYKQDIGLINSKDEYISATNDVVLSFPFKDCVLEFDSTDPDQKREEVFFNETLAHDEIDHLFSNKVLTNAKLIDKDGEKELTKFDGNSNLLIKGNNLLAMYSLLPRYKGQVKLIYWDILYNTKNDRPPYPDSFKHSSWLTMMKNRLDIAKKLLKDDGIICLQCDDNEMTYLKVLMDELFDRDNYLITLMEQVRYSDKSLNEKSDFQPVFEYLLVYKSTKNKATIYRPTIEYSLNKFIFEIKEISPGEEFEVNGRKVTVFKKGEWSITKSKEPGMSKLKETWITGAIYSGTGHGLMWQRVVEPRISKDGYECLYKVDGLGDDGLGYRYYTGPQKKAARYGKMYTAVPINRKKEIENGIVSKKELTIVNYINISPDLGNCRQEGGVELQAGKKPELYINYLLTLFTKENDIVLDAYFGSGTTGAVAMKMGRRFIGIEQLDSHIELAKTRLKNVIAGDETGISKAVDWKGGGSFTYCELKRLNDNYVEEIKCANTKCELCNAWKRMFDTGFVSCFADKDKVLKMITDPDNTSIDDMKKILIELLDKNQLYVNYSDMDDANFKVSDKDKKFTESFYNAK